MDYSTLFFDIFGLFIILFGFYYFTNIITEQNKKYEILINNLFYYDQQYKEILELKNRIHKIEQKVNKINK